MNDKSGVTPVICVDTEAQIGALCKKIMTGTVFADTIHYYRVRQTVADFDCIAGDVKKRVLSCFIEMSPKRHDFNEILFSFIEIYKWNFNCIACACKIQDHPRQD